MLHPGYEEAGSLPKLTVCTTRQPGRACSTTCNNLIPVDTVILSCAALL
jgi:hydroxylamine reductase (hybrid-cluster protein)